MKTVIFDLDGTLADTGKDLLAAANACFRGLGHGDLLDLETDQATAFAGGRAMLGLGFSRLGLKEAEALIDQQFPLLLQHYGAQIDRYTRLYDGVEPALAQLAKAGYRLGVCTNKPEALAETLLQKLGIRPLFQSLIGADTLTQRKPDAAPYHAAVERAGGTVGRSVLIGDTITDRNTATAAGVPVVLVTFGPSGRAVAQMQPEGLLEHYDQLFGLVEQLIDGA